MKGNGSSHSFSSMSSQNEEISRNVRVSVWWDMGNCPIPNEGNALKIARNITDALRVNGIKGPVSITAFCDFRQVSKPVQDNLRLTGVSLKHIPGGKDVTERSLLADLVFWASENPPPAHLFLISGDKEFANVLHRLRMINYNILLASQDPAPGVLCSATSIMWQWCHIVEGENYRGKHFSEPPDGSWYGHNKVPLEDPFADMEQVTNAQPEDFLLAYTGSKPLPIPKAIVSHIRFIVNSYPQGVDIVELQSELERNNVPMDENFFGYKKFSVLLESLPTAVKLHSTGDGQIFVHSSQSKIPEPVCRNNISEPFLQPKVSGTLDQQKAAVQVNKSKVSGSLDQQIAAEPLIQSRFPEPLDQPKVADPINYCVRPPRISEANNGDGMETLSEVLNGREGSVTTKVNGEPSLQADTAPTMDPPGETKEDVIQLKEGQSSSIEKNDTINEVGFCRRVWRTIFCRNSDSSDKGSNGSSDSESHSTKADCSEKGNLEERLVSISSSDLSKSVSEEKEKRDSEENSMFGKIVKWCRSGKTSTISDEEKGQFSEEDNQRNSLTDINGVFSNAAFWEETLSFLQTKGTNLIYQSKTREQLAQRLQKVGPSHLSSLSEGDLNHMVDLLISEKKWLEESTGRTFPFKLIHPARNSAPSSNSNGSLVSALFGANSSQSNMRRSPFHERVDEKKRGTFSGARSVESNKNPSGRSKSEILADCKKLVAEKLIYQPDGFRMSNFKPWFHERYGYNLDHSKLGYPKLAALLVTIPGTDVDGEFLCSSKKSSKNIIPYNVETKGSNNKDSRSSLESNNRKNSSRSDINGERIEVASDDDSYLTSGISDSEGSSELDEKIPSEEDSSLLNLLDSFHRKNGRPHDSSR